MQHYFEKMWYQQGKRAYLWLPLAGLFYLISTARRYFFLRKKPKKLAVPVVIVGNISVGGTGKTPLIISLVEQLKHQGINAGVISRGYGGKAIYPCAVNAQSSAAAVGDEPLLIYQRCACPVVVSPNRLEAAQYLLANFSVDVILSDDGLQHYALPRDIELVVIDGKRGLGNGLCLPAGPLRETAKRLSSVDFVLINGESTAAYSSQQYHFTLKAEPIQPLHRNVQQELSQKVHALAGIGNPQRFFHTLSTQGFTLITHSFADHYLYSEEDLQFGDDLSVVMTEKDAVKCRQFSALDNHWFLPVSAQLSEDFLRALIEKIQQYR